MDGHRGAAAADAAGGATAGAAAGHARRRLRVDKAACIGAGRQRSERSDAVAEWSTWRCAMSIRFDAEAVDRFWILPCIFGLPRPVQCLPVALWSERAVRAVSVGFLGAIIVADQETLGKSLAEAISGYSDGGLQPCTVWTGAAGAAALLPLFQVRGLGALHGCRPSAD